MSWAGLPPGAALRWRPERKQRPREVTQGSVGVWLGRGGGPTGMWEWMALWAVGGAASLGTSRRWRVVPPRDEATRPLIPEPPSAQVGGRAT